MGGKGGGGERGACGLCRAGGGWIVGGCCAAGDGGE